MVTVQRVTTNCMAYQQLAARLRYLGKYLISTQHPILHRCIVRVVTINVLILIHYKLRRRPAHSCTFSDKWLNHKWTFFICYKHLKAKETNPRPIPSYEFKNADPLPQGLHNYYLQTTSYTQCYLLRCCPDKLNRNAFSLCNSTQIKIIQSEPKLGPIIQASIPLTALYCLSLKGVIKSQTKCTGNQASNPAFLANPCQTKP